MNNNINPNNMQNCLINFFAARPIDNAIERNEPAIEVQKPVNCRDFQQNMPGQRRQRGLIIIMFYKCLIIEII